MDKQELDIRLQEGRVFSVGKSFIFAVQIPDDSQGCSASRCSNCETVVAYCHMVCKNCGFPLVGPFGFPQLPQWQSLTLADRRVEVEEVYCHHGNYGRLRWVNVPHVPLHFREAAALKALNCDEAERYRRVHGIEPDAEFLSLF